MVGSVVEYLPNIVPLEDIDVSKQLEKTFKKKGIGIMTNSSNNQNIYFLLDTRRCFFDQ